MSILTTASAVLSITQVSAGVTASPEAAHLALYETCVAVVIAVLVVFYFDERVRGGMTLKQRGRAVGWLGASGTLPHGDLRYRHEHVGAGG